MQRKARASQQRVAVVPEAAAARQISEGEFREKKSFDRAGAKSRRGKKQQHLRGRSSTVINRINSAAGLVPAEALTSCSDSWSRGYSGSSSSSSIKASYVPRRGRGPCIYDTYIDPLRCRRRRRRLLYILPIQRVSETIWLLRLPIYMCFSAGSASRVRSSSTKEPEQPSSICTLGEALNIVEQPSRLCSSTLHYRAFIYTCILINNRSMSL
uniref:Uncharacterized protein n=1 Tax=Trichogramma kaykai TaxID=54128 RepID=A0ABD2WAZ2_9HYME